MRFRPSTYESSARDDPKPDLRLWLRLLTCATMIEGEIRSRRLMVSNGNVRGVADRLLAAGLVSREPSPTDRRITFVRLTPAGCSAYRAVAAAHGAWVADVFSGLTREDMAELMRLLGRVKQSVRDRAPRKRPQ